jgi:hypothetical protein
VEDYVGGVLVGHGGCWREFAPGAGGPPRAQAACVDGRGERLL